MRVKMKMNLWPVLLSNFSRAGMREDRWLESVYYSGGVYSVFETFFNSYNHVLGNVRVKDIVIIL